MKKLNKKGIVPLVVWGFLAVGGLIGGAWFLSQTNKTVENIGGGFLGLPIVAWIVIILLLMIAGQRR